MTQEELARRARVSERTIRRLETGESVNPQLETVRLLADALGLQPEQRARLLAVADGRAEPALPSTGAEQRIQETADDLAQAVGARWRREEELRRIQDPFPLPVRWEMAPETLMDHWPNICRASAGASAEPLDLTGQLDEIVDIYRRIPSGRLVVLGQGGSGKTILAIRFVLDLLKTRTATDAVPVVVGLGSWNPNETGFRDWLIGQLVRDYPGLAAANADGSTLAAALVDTDRVLPVLDGFDEIAEGLHRPALEALSATTLPLLLTSRPEEFAAAVRNDVLTAAAAVQLTDLTVADVVNYLPRTTRKAAATVWDPVLKALTGSQFGEALTTPLMVGLARAIYSDGSDRDPAELLDTNRFNSAEAVEEHLLGSFIPTVYRPGGRFEPEHVQRWLGYLARHLTRLGSHDLAWWQVGNSLNRSARTLIVGLVSGLAFGILSGLVIFFVDSVEGGLRQGAIDGLVSALGNWLAFGLAFALAHLVGLRLGGGTFEPSRVRLRTVGGARNLRARFVPRLLVGVAGGVGLGLVLGVATAGAGLDFIGLVDFGFWGTFATGIGLGAASGLVWGLAAGLETPVDVRSAVNPVDLLKANRTTMVAEFCAWGLALGLMHWLLVGLVRGFADGLGSALVLELVLGPMVGLGIGTGLTAWGQWVVLARVWLPLTGRLPWAPIAFLDDACRRGVLRQAGAVYQFRHARLQAHLTGTGHRRPVPDLV